VQTKLRFQPISFSWVALHPQPKGVITFIGGAFFGSFPTLFYRYFLEQLFNAGYTLIALPFRFTFNHWSVAAGLLEEQQVLQRELIQMARRAKYPTELYEHAENYYWIGHSLGCKYIALLELLSGNRWQADAEVCLNSSQPEHQIQQIKKLLPNNSIRDQRSLLMAPDISNTESAIRIKPLANLLDYLGLGVRPNRQQTLCLIQRSQLFNLTAMISFDRDQVAGSVRDADEQKSDVLWLFDHLGCQLINKELSGKHLEPVGVRIGNSIVDLNPFDKFIEPLSRRDLEAIVMDFLEQLKHR
jgi:hypothetical protein